MKNFYIEDLSNNEKLIESNDPMDIIKYLKDNSSLRRYVCDINLKGANLNDEDLTGANLSYVNLGYTGLFEADLSGANLNDANMKNTNLVGANLENVKLYDTIGDGNRIKILHTGLYIINEYDDRLQIGHKNHSKQEWRSFTDDEINEMVDINDNTLDFWRDWKPKLISMSWL